VVVVSGSAQTSLHLVCSRCAIPFHLDVSPRFSALFCSDPVMAGVGHLDGNRPAGQNHGFARHAPTPSGESGKDLDITYLSENVIDLGDVLAEQLQLQIPFQPLCKTECRGICPRCGADLNAGRCACVSLERDNPFAVLMPRIKDLKIEA
jgi:uncharacterized metal-binding protein YceD (DUF177 family)